MNINIPAKWLPPQFLMIFDNTEKNVATHSFAVHVFQYYEQEITPWELGALARAKNFSDNVANKLHLVGVSSHEFFKPPTRH